jgi:hypothetical protein
MPSRKALDTQKDILTPARGELQEKRSWHKSQRYRAEKPCVAIKLC